MRDNAEGSGNRKPGWRSRERKRPAPLAKPVPAILMSLSFSCTRSPAQASVPLSSSQPSSNSAS